MTITVVNQLSTADGRRYEHEDCGLCCSLSDAVDAGLPRDETIASMETWYALHGDSPVDGTGCEINAQWLRGEGLTAQSFQGSMDLVDTYLAAGWRVILAIRSNSSGYPYSGAGCVGHFLGICARNPDGSYTVMQPVGGYVVTYRRDLLAANSQGAGVVIQHDYRSAGVTTVVGTSSGGHPMTFDPNKMRRGFNFTVRFLTGSGGEAAADLDFDDAHAASLGGGEEEFLVEGELQGSDKATDPQIHIGAARLRALAQGDIPDDLVPALKRKLGLS